MSVARVLGRLTELVKIGKVSEATAIRLLEQSGVVLTCPGKVGVYCNGMLKVKAGVVSLDPEAITDFCIPEPEVAKKAPAPKAPAPKAPAPKAPAPKPPASTVKPASKPDVVDPVS